MTQDKNIELRKLIQLINQPSLKDKAKRKLINDLFKVIEPELKEKSRKIVKVTEKDDFTVEDALQNTYINIQTYLHTYKPEKSEVMTWVTNIYKKEFYKLSKKQKKAGIKSAPIKDKNSTSEEQNDLLVISIDAANYDVPVSDETNEVCSDSFDKLVAQNPSKLLKDIKEFIEKDLESSLKEIVIRSKTAGKQITLQTVLLMRLQDKTLKKISAKTEVPLNSISSCIDRKMPKVKDYITEYTGIEFG